MSFSSRPTDLLKRPPVYTCRAHGEYPSTTDDWMGQQNHCPACVREARQLEVGFRAECDRVRRWKACEVPTRFAGATLDTWKATTPTQVAAHRAISAWCDTIPSMENGVGLYLSGPPGIGKTHLAVACLIECLRRSTWSVLYVQWGALLSEVKAAYRSRATDNVDPLDALYTRRLVVLDELGVRAGSEFDAGTLFDVIDHRYRHGLPTIAVTNATAATAAGLLGERVVDRLREMAIPVPMTGASMRVAPRGVSQPQAPFPMPPEFIEVPECYAGTNRLVRIARDGSRLAPLPSRGAPSSSRAQ